MGGIIITIYRAKNRHIQFGKYCILKINMKMIEQIKKGFT